MALALKSELCDVGGNEFSMLRNDLWKGLHGACLFCGGS